jgi:hypothetical protein
MEVCTRSSISPRPTPGPATTRGQRGRGATTESLSRPHRPDMGGHSLDRRSDLQCCNTRASSRACARPGCPRGRSRWTRPPQRRRIDEASSRLNARNCDVHRRDPNVRSTSTPAVYCVSSRSASSASSPCQFAEPTAGSGRLPDDLLCSIAVSTRHYRPDDAGGLVGEGLVRATAVAAGWFDTSSRTAR